MGSLRSKVGAKSMGTIGAGTVSNAAPASPKPWDSDVFAPEPLKPAANSVDRQTPDASQPKKDKRRKSTINKGADRQLGQLEAEGY